MSHNEISVSLDQKKSRYWQSNIRMMLILLAVWFVVTFVVGFFARELNVISFFGFPLGFYMGAQGALICYVAIIGFYARYMNSLDQEYGVDEDTA